MADRQRIQRKLSQADRSLIETTALSICLAEPAASRVWKPTLDATTRKLATIAHAGAGTACGFDDQGALVRENAGRLEGGACATCQAAGNGFGHLAVEVRPVDEQHIWEDIEPRHVTLGKPSRDR